MWRATLRSAGCDGGLNRSRGLFFFGAPFVRRFSRRRSEFARENSGQWGPERNENDIFIFWCPASLSVYYAAEFPCRNPHSATKTTAGNLKPFRKSIFSGL